MINTFTTIGQIVVRQLDRSVIMNFAFFVIHYIKKVCIAYIWEHIWDLKIDLNEFESYVYFYRTYSVHYSCRRDERNLFFMNDQTFPLTLSGKVV